MNILGISAGFHDAAVTLINQHGDILFAGHSERYSKIKHDAKLCNGLIEDAMSYGTPDMIAYYERPWVKKTRQLYAGQYSELTTPWTVRGILSDIPGVNDIPIETYNHHLSHAAAGFQTSAFNDATVVVIDAIGEWDTISIWSAYYEHGRAKYKKVWGQKYPHSIGLMYSAFTKEVGLRPLDEEYILMGMAGWAKKNTSRLSDQLSNWLVDHEFDLTLKHNLHIGLPDNNIKASWTDFEIANAAQTLTEQLIHNIMHKAMTLAPNSNLVYSGGVALNCSANRDLGEYFDNIWIMPNPGDAGSSLGAAALAYGGKLNWVDAFLGYNIPGPYPVTDVVSELVTNKIVGVASGRAEFGPRALGNRSLLADPRGPDIKDAVNLIKRRQQFRPFAPIIMEEFVDEYFEMPNGFKTSPYMQTTAKCLRPKEFPAIIHVDGTSRVQTVPKDGSGIRQLLEAWYVWTGCPMLLNTSLNIRGEPMVNDRADADRFEQLYGVKVLS